MTPRRRLLLFLVCCGLLTAAVVSRVTVATDMSFFLPRQGSAELSVMTNGLQGGGDILMIRLSGAAHPGDMAVASDRVTAALRAQPEFLFVLNGRPHLPAALTDFLLENRYLVGPPIPADHFSPGKLRQAIESGIDNLATTAGWTFRELFFRDPVNRLQAVADGLGPGDAGPPRRAGVWMDAQGRGLILARLRAAAGDLTAQAAAQRALDDAVRKAATPGLFWTASGPGRFALNTADRIRSEMQLLSALATALVAGILWLAFRTPKVLLPVAIPVGLGVVAGIAVTQLVFGQVHGVAMTFGAVLCGVGADYPIHLVAFRFGDEPLRATARRLSRPLLIGAATTGAGLLALTQSSFPGLAQIGLLAAVGVFTSVAVSRWLLPWLVALPPQALRPGFAGQAARLSGGAPSTRRKLRYFSIALITIAAVGAALKSAPLWEQDLSHLTLPDAAGKSLDGELRRQFAIPDVRRMLLLQADSAEEILQRQQALTPALDRAVQSGALGGYRMAVQLLPPMAEQRARQAQLPAAEALRQRLEMAAQGTAASARAFSPFLQDVARQRQAPPIDIAAAERYALGSIVALPWRHGEKWVGVVTLAPPIRLEGAALLTATPVDLQQVAATLVEDYRKEALFWLMLGGGAGVLILLAGLRRVGQTLRVVFPVVAAVGATMAVLVAAGTALSLFHILGLLLVASIGVDYALFFQAENVDNSHRDDNSRRGAYSVALCCLTTVGVFATLATSSIPVLGSIGVTVAVGVALSYLFTVSFAKADP